MAKYTWSSTFENWLNEYGQIFHKFEGHDSGNVSHGVKTTASKHFIKFAPNKIETAVNFLKNAYKLAENINHPTLPELQFSIESNDGLALVYDWVDGENVNEVTNLNKQNIKKSRKDPKSPYSRFRSLPSEKIIKVLDQIFDLHVSLESKGYVSCDWYDGCIIYNFKNDSLHIIDLDIYHKGPFKNTMGRMYGSSRFMAPEEFKKDQIIDKQTTVYHMSATVFEFLGRGKKEPHKGFRGSKELFNVALKAIQENKKDRYCSVREFYLKWLKSLEDRDSR